MRPCLAAALTLFAFEGALAASTPVRLEGLLLPPVEGGVPAVQSWNMLSIDMDVPPIVPGTFSHGPAGFTLVDVPGSLRVFGRGADTAFQASWFAGSLMTGVDFRFADVVEPGDQWQVVLFFRQAPFEGSPAAPTLRSMASGGSGFVYWYRPDDDGVEWSLQGRYQAGLVPEPASAALLLAGGVAVAGLARRRRGAAATA